ncbi:MAG: hypothetical protein JW993_21190 [Sedimentisphaerales bacterium]|nr:hypothetical protein [Sedimentisphaerales bacterium]
MDTSQLRTILWLRWHLTRNQWYRGGWLNKAASFFVAGAGIVIGFGGAVAGLLVGALVLTKARPLVLLGIWDVLVGMFLFFWMAGIVSDIQRSETIDIGRVLHLPVSLRQVFFINYIASHLTLVAILFLPGMLGFAAGLALGRGGLMVLLVPLAIGFIFMITAWTYCLRGWLVTLMINPRRRRVVIAVVTFSFILLSQLPNLLGHTFGRGRDSQPSAKETSPSTEQTPSPDTTARRPASLPRAWQIANIAVPLLWVGYGAMSLAQGNVWPALWITAGVFLMGGLGLRRAYRSTIRFYEGQAKEGGRPRTEDKGRIAAQSRPIRTSLLEKALPGVPDEAAAMALAYFRSLMRAPEVKMALATNFLMLLFFGAMFLLRRSSGFEDVIKPFIATGAISLTFFGLIQLMFNLFGYDRGGFRAIVLLPTPRRHILLGKNLALLPIVACIAGAVQLLVTFAARLPILVVLATALQLPAAFLLLSTAGNLVSVVVPYRVAPGSMKPTKVPTLTALLMFVTHLLFPAAMVPIFLPPGLGLLASRLGWAPAGAVNLALSALLLVLFALCYRVCLPGLGALLQQREQAILQVVTHEVE